MKQLLNFGLGFKIVQDSFKMASRWSNMAPRWPKRVPRELQKCQRPAKIGQDGPRIAQDGPKMAPRWAKMLPGRPQDPDTHGRPFGDFTQYNGFGGVRQVNEVKDLSCGLGAFSSFQQVHRPMEAHMALLILLFLLSQLYKGDWVEGLKG